MLNIEKPNHILEEPRNIFRDELYKERPEMKTSNIKILNEKEDIGKVLTKIKFEKS
ncbi:MAG: hypothetical protein ACFFC3_12000 [Candidatus Odinarchaeota archaeon]